jgi:hypothetical protein
VRFDVTVSSELTPERTQAVLDVLERRRNASEQR